MKIIPESGPVKIPEELGKLSYSSWKCTFKMCRLPPRHQCDPATYQENNSSSEILPDFKEL